MQNLQTSIGKFAVCSEICKESSKSRAGFAKNWLKGYVQPMPRHRSGIPDTSGAGAKDILDLATANNVRFLRLQFTDILGVNKNVEVPASQFEKALAGDIMFKPRPDEEPSTITHDVGSYFDLAPADLGEDARRAIVDVLERMGFEVEAAHHEVAHGQHEIDFRYAEALKTADNIATFRFVVKYVAQTFGLTASFMPKPIFGQNGSGMHTHQSLFRGKENAFWDKDAEDRRA